MRQVPFVEQSLNKIIITGIATRAECSNKQIVESFLCYPRILKYLWIIIHNSLDKNEKNYM